MFNIVKKTFAYGAHQVTLETGEIARQAGGAVLVSMEETVVLVTVVAAKSTKPGQDFFPLTVDYQEKAYAAGRIPGGFFKREGRPSEKETLTSRLIDRPIRPLFPDGFYNEVQVIATVMSLESGSRSRYSGDDRRFRRAVDLRRAVQRPDRCGARRLHQRPVRSVPDPEPAQGFAARPRRRRYRIRRADGRIRSPGTVRGSHARRRRFRSHRNAAR